MLFTDPDCYQLVSMNLIDQETGKMPVKKMKDITTATTTYEYVLM